MVASRKLHRYTYAEYRTLEETSSTKHEFLEGEIYAMAGGTPEHAALSSAVGAALSRQLEGTDCRVYSSDLRIRVLATGLAAYPDVTVVCGPISVDLEDKNAVTNPAIVVEVLSNATEDYDRGEKLDQYRAIPSLQAVILVSHRAREIEVWSRTSTTGWTSNTTHAGKTARIEARQLSLAVDHIYDTAGAL